MATRHWHYGLIGIGFAFAAAALSGCEATVNPPPADPQYCPQVYQPVCARTEEGGKTFPNACVARASGYEGYAPGACGPRKPDRVCPQIYQPVCAQIGNQYRTYSNDCVAGAEGARAVYQGACKGG